jgi:hypothetical protein
MAKATLADLEARALDAIEKEEDIVYDTAAEVGQIVGNVSHMHWFKKAIMRALTENVGKYAHLTVA